MKIEEIKRLLVDLPTLPGCYQFLNDEGVVIYVGKAKNLRKRVSSYFHKQHADAKTRRLVAAIADFRYFVVGSEAEALLLENSLIKTHQPKFNILLKDDKSYPSIVITQEVFPRIFITRDLTLKGRYYGPYTNVGLAYEMLELLRELYHLRTCRLALDEQGIKERRWRVCLQYHIKRCTAPCVGLVSRAEVLSCVDDAERILRGDITEAEEQIQARMADFAEQLRFEEAHEEKRRLDLLSRYTSKHLVAPHLPGKIDVFAYDALAETVFVTMMQIARGMVVRMVSHQWQKPLEEEPADILASIIVELRQRYPSDAKEIILPFEISFPPKDGVVMHVPQRGIKRQLLALAQSNVEQYKEDSLLRAEKLNPEQRASRLMHTMQEELGLRRLPLHIECFDNSNLQGTDSVASCVVFRLGKPAKKEYRTFHVKSVIGANDYASMEEIVFRRYSRLVAEEEPLPDLVLIDGGKGQLMAALSACEQLGIQDQVELAALAERVDELFFPGRSEPLFLARKSESLRILQMARDEAHRFGLQFHRKLRSKRQIASELDQIKGVGVKTKEKLLKAFGSVAKIRASTHEELSAVVGEKKATLIKEELSGKM